MRRFARLYIHSINEVIDSLRNVIGVLSSLKIFFTQVQWRQGTPKEASMFLTLGGTVISQLPCITLC
jgi:hypothetical protein